MAMVKPTVQTSCNDACGGSSVSLGEDRRGVTTVRAPRRAAATGARMRREAPVCLYIAKVCLQLDYSICCFGILIA